MEMHVRLSVISGVLEIFVTCMNGLSRQSELLNAEIARVRSSVLRHCISSSTLLDYVVGLFNLLLQEIHTMPSPCELPIR